MFQTYLVTGASGFLGRAVLAELRRKNVQICAFLMENDPLERELPQQVSVVRGDICDDGSLDRFFSGADHTACVIHCAGIVSVASHPGRQIYRVNVGGTEKILRYCREKKVGKLVYVSSVHAIPPKPNGMEITEKAVFSPELVEGDYAKSKAIATGLVFDAARQGLNASVVYPSGIIGPGDFGKGGITNMLLSFLAGKLPLAVKGGYDFVDVRDVAKGIVSCTEKGLAGHGYILSGQYVSVRDILEAAEETVQLNRRVFYLPVSIAKRIAMIHEKWSLKKGKPLIFTPYAVSVLDSNGHFSRDAATAAFGYAPRPVKSSIRDTVLWLKKSI